MEAYKVGEAIKLTRVSRKYGCRKGIIKGAVKLYSNDKLKYPNTNSKDIQLSLNSDIFDQSVVYQGYIVDCVDILGEFKETITCTEGMIRKSQ